MDNITRRVLLVEDNEDDYLIVRDLLSDIPTSKFDLQWAQSYQDARKLLTHHQYDVCLLDYGLGELTGVELVREFAASGTPFILLTGNEDYDVDVAAAKAGAADYLLKGHINALLLERAIRYAIERKQAEAALYAREEFQRTLLENFPNGSVNVFDRDLRYVLAAGSGLELSGLTSAQLAGKTLDEVFSPEQVALAKPHYEKVLSGQTVEFELPLTERFYNISAAPLYDLDGEVFNIVAVAQDITERRNAEERLRQSQANLAKAQQIAHLGSWELDLANLEDINTNPLRWSDEVFRIFGYQPGQIEVSNENFLRAVHPDDREQITMAMSQAVHAGKAFDLDHRILLPNGTERIVYEQAELVSDASGKPIKMVGTVKDITEHKQSEQAIKLRPLLALTSIATLLVLSATDLAQEFLLQHLGESAARLAELIPNTLAITGIVYLILRKQERLFQQALSAITDRKQAEALLKENQQRLTLATESAHIGIWDWDVVLNEMMWDARMVALYGIQEQDFSGAYDAWQTGLHPEDREQAEADLTAALNGSRDFHSQFRVIWPTGEVRHIEAHALVQRAPDGSALRMIGVNWDITERKMAEQAVQKSEQEQRQLAAELETERARLVAAQAVSKVGSWEIDLSTQAEVWSAEVHRILELDPEQVQPTHQGFLQAVHPEDRIAVDAAFLQSFDQHLPCVKEHRLLLPGGRIKSVEQRWQVFFDEQQKPVRATGTIQDITERQQSEMALRQSEERYRSLTLATSQIVWTAPADGMVEDIPAWRHFTGQSLEEVQGRNWLQAVHPDDRERAEKLTVKAAETRSLYETEYRIRAADGNYRLFSVRGVPILESDGSIREWVGTCTDIHDQRQAEEERDRFFTLSLDMLAISNGEGYFKRLNPAFEATLGFSNAELMAVPFLEFVHPDDIADTLAEMAKLENGALILQFENRYRCRDGSYKWLRWMATPFKDLWYSVAHDVTSAKETAAALRESEERFRQMAESVDEVFWLFDPVEENLLYVSPALEKVWGRSRQSLLDQSMSFMDTVHPEDRNGVLAALEHQGEPNGYSLEHRIIRPDGAVRWVWGRTFPIYDEKGEVYRIAGIAQDISARKEAEAALYEANNVLELRVEERTAELQQANAETRKRARQQEAVAELGQRALTTVDMDTLLTGATALVTETLGVEIGSILELIPGSSSLRIRTGTGWKTDNMGSVVPGDASSQAGYALLSNLPVVVTDLRSETRFQPSRPMLEEGVVSGIAVIVGSQRQPFGVIGAHTRQQRNFTQDDIHFLQAIANVLAASLEQRRAEEALYKNHEFLEAVLENTAEGIVACDADGRLTFFNRATREFHGLPIEPLPAEQWSQFYSLYMPDGITPMQKEDVPLFRALRGDHVRDTEMIIAAHEGSPRLVTNNGELLFDADGEKIGAVVVMHDITERRQAEAELQRSRHELQNFIDAMTTLAAKVAPDGTFLIANKVAFDASGIPREEYMKTNFLEGPWWTFDPEVQTRVRDRFQESLNGTLINYDENIFVFGEERTINFSLIPILDAGGKVEYLIAEGRDITALKQTEEALQQAKAEAERANRAKSEFLSRMSHELRTPLNAILGFGQILNTQDIPPMSKESVGYILKGGRHLLDLINEVLDIARVESGHLDLSLEPVALDDVVPDACAMMRPLAKQHGIHLGESIAGLGHIHVLADRQRLKQVLINLLANAIKYNCEGGEVEVSCDHQPDGRTTIAIRDTGPGLSPQDLTKLFIPFERLGASTSTIEGTGLGLALSQRMVTAMGGTLNVQSTLGQGTIFTVELAQTALDNQFVSPLETTHRLESTHRLDTSRKTQRTCSVLYIEDNPSNLQLMEAIFESRPEVTLLTAMQGSVGLDLARQHEPDLILLDLNLPDINGKEVLTRLQQSALTREIPVIIVSADATSNQIERLIAAGAKSYLTKPLDVEQVLLTVDELLP